MSQEAASLAQANQTQATQSKAPKNKEPYQQAYYPPVPTGFTRYMRSSVVWQFWRFIVINLKIFKLMFRSHH